MLFDDLVEFDDAVGGVRRHRQLQGVGGAHGVLQELEARGLDLARHQDAAHAAVRRAVVFFDPGQRGFQPLTAEFVVARADEPAALVRHPAPAVVARREIGAAAEAAYLGEQRVLHARLAAVFDERRHPVAQKLGDRERRVELERGRRSLIPMLEVPRIALNHFALLGNGNFKKRLPAIHRPAGIGDQPMRGAVAGVDVGVDESRRNQLVLGIDYPIDATFECLSDVEDRVPFEYDLGVAQKRMLAALIAHHPRRLDLAAHAVSSPALGFATIMARARGALPSPRGAGSWPEP